MALQALPIPADFNQPTAAQQLMALSPLDGRYASKLSALAPYFSEYGLFRYRVLVEVEYLIALAEIPLPQLKDLTKDHYPALRDLYLNFTTADAEAIKKIEATTNHDVKAVEYWLKDKMSAMGLESVLEFIHFGLTSQDVNNTAIPLCLKHAHQQVLAPKLESVISRLEELALGWQTVPMLARTHGQPASPTLLGKELQVFVARLQEQLNLLNQTRWAAKLGGATGGFNAHAIAYPDVNWPAFANGLVNETLGLSRTQFTTQIEPYDNLAYYADGMRRLNVILLDLCRDVWHYISIGYFKQKTKAGEVGSSAMPHKVNPIDFENAEGNLGLANAILDHLANKLPISRLQRDLTDSTVLRNLGVPLGHTLLAYESLLKGLGKLELNSQALLSDLQNTPEVLAEAIQTILRREGYPAPYEALKALTRGQAGITLESMAEFIQGLEVSAAVKAELLALRPETYTGVMKNW